MVNMERSRAKTYFPELLKSNPKKMAISSQSCSFLSAESFTNIFVKEDSNPMIDGIISFVQTYDDEIHKLEAERQEALKMAEIEEEKERQITEAAEFKIHQVLNTQVDNVLKCRKYFYKRTCPVKIPFKSTATHEEHVAYLRAFIKFQIRPPKTAMEEAEYQYYLTLQNKFLQEQTCMMNFSYEALKLQLSEINKVPENIDSYMAAYVQHRSKRALQYSNDFTQEMDIPLKPEDPKGNMTDISFDYIGNLLSIGTAAKFHQPNPYYQHVLPGKDNWLKKKPHTCDERFNKKKYLYKTPVSDDPNAEHLAKMHNVSIVMSASAFKTLVNNQDTFDKEWTIPVKIKTHETKDSLGNVVPLRVAYIDKPLVRKAWLPLQKKRTYYKMAAVEKFTEYSDDPYYQFCRNTTSAFDDYVDVDKPFDSSVNSPDIKTEKVGSSPAKMHIKLTGDTSDSRDRPKASPVKREHEETSTSTITPKKCIKTKSSKENVGFLNDLLANQSAMTKKYIKTESSNKDVGFLNDLITNQSTMLKTQSTPVEAKSYSVTSNIRSYLPPCGAPSTFDMPWSQTTGSDKNKFKIKECPPNSKTNVHYQLFSLNNPKTNESLPILVRHNVHGISSRNVGRRHLSAEAIVVHPKIENQAYFGIEVNSYHDIVDQWASLVTKPNSVLLQLHVCTETGTIIMGSKKRLVDIVQEGKQKHINFHPESVLAPLYVALQSTLKMTSGEYILFHSGKTGAFIHLMKASILDKGATSRPTLNIHAAYEKGEMLSRFYMSVPWLAIDTHVLTPFHLMHCKVPATFPMVNTEKLSQRKKSFIKAKAKNKKTIKEF